MYLRALTYYYVSADGKWHSLGKDKARALRLWAEWECHLQTVTVAEIVKRYISDCMDGQAESTRKRYQSYARTIEEAFPALPADDLTRFAIARWKHGGIKPVWFNGCLSLLRVAYRQAGEWGWATTNEAEQVTFNPVAGRDRLLTPDEFRQIRDGAPRWLQVAMDIAYLTSLRESDILALRWNQVTDRLYVTQIKTGNRQAFDISPALRSVLEAAKRAPIIGLFVVATDKGKPISARRLQDHFAQARDAAGVDDVRFHDIRGMAATVADEEGLDTQAMLGHSDPKMTERYIKRRRVVRAPTLKRRL